MDYQTDNQNSNTLMEHSIDLVNYLLAFEDYDLPDAVLVAEKRFGTPARVLSDWFEGDVEVAYDHSSHLSSPF